VSEVQLDEGHTAGRQFLCPDLKEKLVSFGQEETEKQGKGESEKELQDVPKQSLGTR
jgi:hypothetical protein